MLTSCGELGRVILFKVPVLGREGGPIRAFENVSPGHGQEEGAQEGPRRRRLRAWPGQVNIPVKMRVASAPCFCPSPARSRTVPRSVEGLKHRATRVQRPGEARAGKWAPCPRAAAASPRARAPPARFLPRLPAERKTARSAARAEAAPPPGVAR